MDKQEKIVCAAIKIKWFDGYNNRSTEFIGVNYKHIRGDSVYEIFCEDYIFLSEAEGFVTSKNRFVDAKEAMRIAVKTGQYPDYEFRKKVCLHEIEEANENKKHNQEHIGFDGQLYVADIGYLENKIKEYDSLLERDYLKPEDLY